MQRGAHRDDVAGGVAGEGGEDWVRGDLQRGWRGECVGGGEFAVDGMQGGL